MIFIADLLFPVSYFSMHLILLETSSYLSKTEDRNVVACIEICTLQAKHILRTAENILLNSIKRRVVELLGSMLPRGRKRCFVMLHAKLSC